MTPERFCSLRQALLRRQPDLTVLTDQVHKPHNLAALLRTCDAVGVFAVHMLHARGAARRARHVNAGTGRWLRLEVHPDVTAAIRDLRGAGLQIVAAHFSSRAVDYRAPDYARPTAIVLGAELRGVSPEAATLADVHAVIPMRGLGGSLNVSVAGALFLYEAARQREAAGLYGQSRLPPELFARTLFEWCYPEVAALCRRHGRPYPALDETGGIVGHPLHPAGTPAAGDSGTTAPGGSP